MRGLARSAGTKRQPHASETAARERLLAAAGELMTERGSTEISLSEISARSGLNSALVAYYFGGKAGMMMALLRRALAVAMVQVAHLPDMDITPRDKLRIHISGMVKTYAQHPYANQLMHRLIAEDGETFGPLIAEEFGIPVAQAQKRILDEGNAAGVFRPIDPVFLYVQIAGACDQLFYGRYQLEHVFGIQDVDDALRRRFVDHLSGVIFDGIALDPGADGADRND